MGTADDDELGRRSEKATRAAVGTHGSAPANHAAVAKTASGAEPEEKTGPEAAVAKTASGAEPEEGTGPEAAVTKTASGAGPEAAVAEGMAGPEAAA